MFLISLREAAECSLLAALVLPFPGVREKRPYIYVLLLGIASALASGFALGYLSYDSPSLPDKETWTFFRRLTEFSVFYLGMAFVALRSPDKTPPAIKSAIKSDKKTLLLTGLFLYGFFSFFFESRSLGSLTRDIGIIKDTPASSFWQALGGISLGLSLIYPALKLLKKLPVFYKATTFPGLLILWGALRFQMGGVGELEEGSLTISLQNGVLAFLGEGLKGIESALMITGHQFMKTPFSGLIEFLRGDRTAMALVVLLVMAPPLYMLIRLFGRNEPVANGIQSGAEKRLRITFFRKDLLLKAAPALLSFFVLIVTIHAANLALNPLYEPEPVPVKADNGSEALRIPISDRMGDLTDGKLRKYAYYYGDKRIIFIAIMKPDGGVGVALDECEVCPPGKGYGQSEGHVVCVYCMTPIAVSTINNPGGCNPIPVPFVLSENTIVVSLEDLIRVYKGARALEKKASHL